MNYELYWDGHIVDSFYAETPAEAEAYRKEFAEMRGLTFYCLRIK